MIDELRRRYPWPAKNPGLPPDPSGWCAGANRKAFIRLCSQETKVVVELGSWCGLSAGLLCQAAPNATIICIDHWRGSAEHQIRPDSKKRLPMLFDIFCSNLWPYRDRLVPMRTTTMEGMSELAGLGIVPDLIYVDASHDTPNVQADVHKALTLFPSTHLVGDDGTWPTVRKGVDNALDTPEGEGRKFSIESCCWEIAVR